jgi:phosphate-selective porin OprO and OprP
MGRRMGRVGDRRPRQHHQSERPAGTTNGVAGGQQTIYTAGLNWYVNGNIRFMFDYLHGNIAKQVSATNGGDAGAKFDAFAMRTQVAF